MIHMPMVVLFESKIILKVKKILAYHIFCCCSLSLKYLMIVCYTREKNIITDKTLY